MLISSPTARLLEEAIDASPLTQSEIATRAGFPRPNILSMMKLGTTKVPLARIPALASALGIDTEEFLTTAIAEYHPEVYEVLNDILGFPLDDAEEEILHLFRLANAREDREDIVLDADSRMVIEAVFRLAARRSA